MSRGLKSAWKWIHLNTKISTDHMTPELKLRLITTECPLWTQQPDNCPYPDPYWAFYWPGGQSLARFIFDQRPVVDEVCLDFGSGCGAVGIAAAMTGAKKVVFNDIDQTALVSCCINAKLNGLHLNSFEFQHKNILNSCNSLTCSTVLVGDMFYDSEFSETLLNQLSQWSKSGKKIYVGDPGRHVLPECLKLIAEYPLPPYITKEHYGFSTGKIFTFNH